MKKEEIEKQREIGKQLFLVNILHYENDRARKGGYSFLSRDNLAAWASMPWILGCIGELTSSSMGRLRTRVMNSNTVPRFNHELNDRVYVGKYPIIESMRYGGTFI